MRVFCDFDGTISVDDATDVVLSRFASSEWQAIEGQWKQGLIGSAECMRRQIALIRASKRELDDLLDTVPIDPGFSDFLDVCAGLGLPVSIVSDGVDYFIHRILANNGIGVLPIIANRLVSLRGEGGTVYSLTAPFSSPTCTADAGVCKCAVIEGTARQIYIGDGRSDFCVSAKASIVFAKGKLVDHCIEQGIPFYGFTDFTDLLQTFKSVLPDITRHDHVMSYSTIV
ncbi:MtnX-like HAD-IB family phosphatase [Rhizobium sp. BK251]|uniref:MtnX-like HAD-IB family phosphatase n=1 Tax=Rhizobium sp. BK251 TaxID=2512125 RepID=UPI0010480B3A|nr:MtnX-like HAD-IB family phosphatase [Rhizobium sp. BK251]TCL71782.1 HAD superfamily phosphoserine phosphatase-like hydrolase/2,3-diketo-5-methylthio-1-phosphopentane phosphatase [Rhizobium sp. BK251]